MLQLGRSRGLDASSISRAHAAAESAHLRKKRGAISAGDFEQLTLIGRGAFGEVWTCREHASGAVYAMKKLDKEAMVERGHVQHVRAEVDVMSEAVTSEWVVQLHCSFSDARHLYLVMEYVPGGDLMALLMKKDILSEDDTRFYMAETARALSDLHRLGFMHRALSPTTCSSTPTATSSSPTSASPRAAASTRSRSRRRRPWAPAARRRRRRRAAAGGAH